MGHQYACEDLRQLLMKNPEVGSLKELGSFFWDMCGSGAVPHSCRALGYLYAAGIVSNLLMIVKTKGV